MAAEQRWSYDRIAASGEADGRTCIFCGKRIVDESQPGLWVKKAEEDNQDTDYVLDRGYSHYQCAQEEQKKRRRSSLTLSEVPDIPKRS